MTSEFMNGHRREGDASVVGHAGEVSFIDSPELEKPSMFPEREVPVVAGPGELIVGGVDLVAARDVLAQLGIEGAADLERLPVSGAIAMLDGLRQLSSAITAVEAHAALHLERSIAEDSRARGESGGDAARIARSEASLALQQSASVAGRTLVSSTRLVRTMPNVLHALAVGRMSPLAAHRVSRALSSAHPARRHQVDQILVQHLGQLEGCGVKECGDATGRILHALDPDGAAARHARAMRKRNVTVTPGDDGMAVLSATVSALDAARIRRSLSLAAEKARAGGDRRGHQAIMADQLTDVLLGRDDGTGTGTLDIGVIITDRSLLAPGHSDAATVEGLGSVPYEHIREEMLRTLRLAEEEDPDLTISIRRLYREPSSGQLVAAESRSRSFPPAMARLLRWSHQTCRGPYCDAPIRQLDHIQPHIAGGPTTLDNGNGLCAGCNQKEQAGRTARVVRDASGARRTVEWTSRHGQAARRGGVNFDPVHTASGPSRRPEHESCPEHESSLEHDPGSRRATSPAHATLETGPSPTETLRRLLDASTAPKRVVSLLSPSNRCDIAFPIVQLGKAA